MIKYESNVHTQETVDESIRTTMKACDIIDADFVTRAKSEFRVVEHIIAIYANDDFPG